MDRKALREKLLKWEKTGKSSMTKAEIKQAIESYEQLIQASIPIPHMTVIRKHSQGEISRLRMMIEAD